MIRTREDERFIARDTGSYRAPLERALRANGKTLVVAAFARKARSNGRYAIALRIPEGAKPRVAGARITAGTN